jgi:hypothetical protein
MKVKTKVKAIRAGAPAVCLRIGRTVAILRCGLAYAGNSILRGDAAGIGMGLNTVSQTAAETEKLMPVEKSLVRSIQESVQGLAKQLKPGKKISKKGAEDMLVKVRQLGEKVDKLYSKGSKGCV